MTTNICDNLMRRYNQISTIVTRHPDTTTLPDRQQYFLCCPRYVWSMGVCTGDNDLTIGW